MRIRPALLFNPAQQPHRQGLRPRIRTLPGTLPPRRVTLTPCRQVYHQGKYNQLAEYLIIEEIQIKKKSYGILLLKIMKNSFLQDICTTLSYNDWLSLVETILDFTEKLKQ